MELVYSVVVLMNSPVTMCLMRFVNLVFVLIQDAQTLKHVISIPQRVVTMGPVILQIPHVMTIIRVRYLTPILQTAIALEFHTLTAR